MASRKTVRAWLEIITIYLMMLFGSCGLKNSCIYRSRGGSKTPPASIFVSQGRQSVSYSKSYVMT